MNTVQTAAEALELVSAIADAFGIGCDARSSAVIMQNIENAIRRSACLHRIEMFHTAPAFDEDGQEIDDQLLNWGEDPDDYIDTYKAVLNMRVLLGPKVEA